MEGILLPVYMSVGVSGNWQGLELKELHGNVAFDVDYVTLERNVPRVSYKPALGGGGGERFWNTLSLNKSGNYNR
jgi:hypothetical protein